MFVGIAALAFSLSIQSAVLAQPVGDIKPLSEAEILNLLVDAVIDYGPDAPTSGPEFFLPGGAYNKHVRVILQGTYVVENGRICVTYAGAGYCRTVVADDNRSYFFGDTDRLDGSLKYHPFVAVRSDRALAN